MPSFNRRTLLASAAATGFAATAAARALDDTLDATPDLTGKTILITGSSSGFGRLGAEYYARLGATVFATMRNTPRPEADELMALAERENLDIRVMRLDVTQDNEVDDVLTGIDKELGGGMVDVLINNAGIGITSAVEIQDMEATKLIFDTNVYGPHRMARAVLPGMRERGSGLIVQISSQLGRVIVPNAGHYSATKFALEAMSEQMAYELVPHGIEVSIIEPGGYPTEIWQNRNVLTAALKERSAAYHLEGYPRAVAAMGNEDGSGRSADPMDVPREIARQIAMPAGTRPLRTPVHPGFKPQIPINELTAKVQTEWLGRSPYGPWIKAVHNVAD